MTRNTFRGDFDKMIAKKARKAKRIRRVEGVKNLVQQFKDNSIPVNKIETAYIYIVENPSFVGWYKVGTTTDIDSRLSKYQTSDPMRGYSIRDKWITCFRYEIEREFLDYATRSTLFTVNGEWVYSEKYSTLKKKLNSFIIKFNKQAKKKKKAKAKIADLEI